MRPRITIGVPVFNGEVHLAEALDALLAQDFEDFELLISDNGSTDGTEEIARQYATRDARVSYHRNECNLGAPENYNQLVHRAQGEYFRWACHDDLCAPTHLSRCLEAFENGPADMVLAYPKTTIIDGQGDEVRKYEDNTETLDARPERRFEHMVRSLHLCNGVLGLCRLELLRKTRLIGAYKGCDHVLLAELAMLGPIVEVPEFLFSRRIDEKLTSYTNTNASDAERAAWLGANKLTFELTTFYLHHLRAALRSPVSPLARLRAAWIVTRLLGLKRWRSIGGEFKGGVKRSLGIGPGRAAS